jgi:hypothetical protein
MRRSICVCEPAFALAGDIGNWKFTYTTAAPLPKGTRLRFDLQSKGRPIDWQIPSTDLKEKSNVIWLELPGGKILPGKALDKPLSSFEFVLPCEVRGSESFFIFIGTKEKDVAKKGNFCQKVAQRRRPFYLYIDPKGRGDYKDPEFFALDVRGNILKTLKVVAPSLVCRNKRFDVIVRFEDVYGNLTSNAPEGTLIDLTYDNLRENLSWKLFVPETGFIALPNLYFNEPGLYKIQLRNLKTGELFHSPPIKCLPESPLSLYWGLLHGESDRTDSGENIEAYLRHIRDERSLQFVATSCFDSEEETSNEVWKRLTQQVIEFNEDERFVAILGFQWLGEPKTEGLRQFLYVKDSKPLLRRKDTKNNSLKKIYKTHSPKEILSIPSFTMGKTTLFDFDDYQPEYERVVEIYNAWGSSECHTKEGNPFPIKGGRKGISEAAEGSLRKALNAGCRFGFVAGGCDDRGPYNNLLSAEQVQYKPGLTAILAKEHSRSSLLEALYNRSCYATTGEKIILGLHIAQFHMGSEIDTKLRPGLEYNRNITGYAIGTQPLIKAELIRNGDVYQVLPIHNDIVEFEINDSELLNQIALNPSKDDQLPFIYYYLRVKQSDGHVAWSSPIWITQAVKAEAFKRARSKK